MRKTKADENSLSHVEEYQNNTDMHNSNVQQYQVSQISGKISCMRKRLKPDVLSTVHETGISTDTRAHVYSTGKGTGISMHRYTTIKYSKGFIANSDHTIPNSLFIT